MPHWLSWPVAMSSHNPEQSGQAAFFPAIIPFFDKTAETGDKKNSGEKYPAHSGRIVGPIGVGGHPVVFSGPGMTF